MGCSPDCEGLFWHEKLNIIIMKKESTKLLTKRGIDKLHDTSSQEYSNHI